MKTKSKAMPTLKNDKAAETFVATADLTKYDLSGFKRMTFEMQPKSAAIHLRLPPSLLQALKTRAKARGMPYTRYVRLLLESDLTKRSA